MRTRIRTALFQHQYALYLGPFVEAIFDQIGVALVPGTAFGHPNSARMSMTLEIAPFEEAMDRLVGFMAKKSS